MDLISLPTLPDKPSALILCALEDLEAIENTPGYGVRMWLWHGYSERQDVCHVCLAGAVMARQGHIPRKLSASPGNFDTDAYKKLMALEYFRVGDVVGGLRTLKYDAPEWAFDYLCYSARWYAYNEDREEWFTQMLSIAALLEAEGL